MVVIHVIIQRRFGEEVYNISVEAENPHTAATLMLQARTKLLAGLLRKEEENESDNG